MCTMFVAQIVEMFEIGIEIEIETIEMKMHWAVVIAVVVMAILIDTLIEMLLRFHLLCCLVSFSLIRHHRPH